MIPSAITGDTLSLSRAERLWSRIHIPVTPDGSLDYDQCWPWVGLTDPKGYGCIVWRLDGRRVRLYPHRLVNEHHALAPFPTGVEIDHTCNCRCCCNPQHHERVDHRTNMARMTARTRPDWRAARDRALMLAHLQEISRHA